MQECFPALGRARDTRAAACDFTFFAYRVANPALVTTNVIPIDQFAATETIYGGSEEPLALAVHERVFWELNDRGINFDLVEPQRRALLAEVFARLSAGKG